MTEGAVVVLDSEGVTDIGSLKNGGPWEETQEGFIQHLLGRAVPHLDIAWYGASSAVGEWSSPSVVGGLHAKGRRLAAIACYYRAHAVVYVGDADNDADPEANRRRVVLEGMEAGIQEFLAKSPAEPVPTPLSGLAIRTIEAWVLGDPAAVDEVRAGRGGDVGVPAHPEDCWGAPHDPSSGHPKQVLHRVFGGTLHGEDYADVGARADPDIVATSCPQGFAPLLQAWRTALGR